MLALLSSVFVIGSSSLSLLFDVARVVFLGLRLRLRLDWGSLPVPVAVSSCIVAALGWLVDEDTDDDVDDDVDDDDEQDDVEWFSSAGKAFAPVRSSAWLLGRNDCTGGCTGA